MMSLRTIREISSKYARKAKRLGTKPLVMTETIIAGLKSGKGRRRIPFLGDYVPEGFHLIDTLFVDSSGWGTSHEAALTQEQFLASLKVGRGYAIVEAGEFQVYVGVFGVNSMGPTDEQLEKFSTALANDASRK